MFLLFKLFVRQNSTMFDGCSAVDGAVHYGCAKSSFPEI